MSRNINGNSQKNTCIASSVYIGEIDHYLTNCRMNNYKNTIGKQFDEWLTKIHECL